VAQAVVPVLDGDDEDTLAQRVLVQEHLIYPRAVRQFIEGRMTVEGNCVRITAEDA
jgi:phosphoribosylglycinamide formyltransferase-1